MHESDCFQYRQDSQRRHQLAHDRRRHGRDEGRGNPCDRLGRRCRRLRRGDRRGGHDGNAGPHRLACPYHLRRLYTEAADRRLPGKLCPWRYHRVHQRLRGACARTAAGSRRRQGSRHRRPQIIRCISSRWHARARRLRHPGAGAERGRFRRDAERRRLARQGGLWRLPDALRIRALCRAGTQAWHRWCIPAARPSPARWAFGPIT